MTYKEIIHFIKESCIRNISVNSFYEGDVYKINSDSDIIYPATILTPGTHVFNQSTTVYNFSLFYVDRLTDDRCNKIDVQSEAIQTLKEISNRLNYDYDSDITYGYSANVFTERFSDDCAGAFITFSIESDDPIRECYIDKDICEECQCD